MEPKDWITAALAVYGAILSSYNLLTARSDRIRRLAVTLSWGLMALSVEPMTMFFVNAANSARRPLTVTGCHLLLPNRKKLVMPRSQGTMQLPGELTEGKSCTFWFPVREVVRALMSEGFTGNVSIKAVVTDALDRSYESRAFAGTVEEWAKAA